MRGFACIGLDNPKHTSNVGSAIRAAGNYNAAMLAVSGHRYRVSATDTIKHYRHMPVLCIKDLHDVIPYDCVPVAVELLPERATALMEYDHPERAFYVFGAEDATLGERVLSWCRDVIYVPTNRCMNLAATVNVVLYDRYAKQYRRAGE